MFWHVSVFLQLPADVSGHFVYTVAHASGSHSSYGSRALPFGWNWSPLIAQRFIGTIMAALDSLLRHWWLYIDDLLLAHSDPVFLTFLGAYACHWLQTAGFIISPKSVLAPAQSITWLGKHLDVRTGITNLPTRHAQVLLCHLDLAHDFLLGSQPSTCVGITAVAGLPAFIGWPLACPRVPVLVLYKWS